MIPTRVLFAPDYRAGVAYQQLLADALLEEGVRVDFLFGQRRVMPLARGVGSYDGDIFHLHWPEKYFERKRDGADLFRKVRYPLDLMLGTRRRPLVVTAHDLRPHNRAGESLLHTNFKFTLNRASAVVVHSRAALATLVETYSIPAKKCRVIPHGDLSVTLGTMPTREEARAQLSIPEGERICLMFGTVEPYKGIEPVIEFWKCARPPATLAVVGKPFSDEYKKSITDLAAGTTDVRLELAWQPEENLKLWLAATDAVVFNYQAIFTSGAACLARSLGLPILIPHRLDTIELAEPHPLVFRFEKFETDFETQLAAALATQPDYSRAASWRELTDWRRIATETAALYRSVLNHQ